MEKIFSNNTKVKFNFNYFKNRTPKELKNHFHTSIIKSVRRIMNNKYDKHLKEIMRCFYSFEYLKDLLSQPEENIKKKLLKAKDKSSYAFNSKLLIQNNQISLNKISHYAEELTNKILLGKPGIIKFLNFINYRKEFSVNDVPWLFSVIIQAKLFNKCKNLIEKKYVNNNQKEILFNYLSKNYEFENLEDVFFSD